MSNSDRLRKNSVKTPDPLPNSKRTYERCSKAVQRPYRLPGVVVEQWRIKNGIAHGPYYFRVWWEGGRQRKRYVRPVDLREVRDACAAWAERQRLDRRRQESLDRMDDARDDRAAAKARDLARLPDYLVDSLLKIDQAFGSLEEAQDVRRALAQIREGGKDAEDMD